MLIILTNSSDVTADYLASELELSGIEFLRFDTDVTVAKSAFQYTHAQVTLTMDQVVYRPESFTNVWYRRPEKLKHPAFDDSPEGGFAYAEWAEALDGFFAHIPRQK